MQIRSGVGKQGKHSLNGAKIGNEKISDLDSIPRFGTDHVSLKRSQFSDSTESLYIMTLIEKSRMNRDIADLAFKKGIMMYMVILGVAIAGLTQSYITIGLFYILVFMSLFVLVVGSVPYIHTMITEKKKMNIILFNLMLKDSSLTDYDENKYTVIKREKNVNAK
jgi:hypothetical protein